MEGFTFWGQKDMKVEELTTNSEEDLEDKEIQGHQNFLSP